MSILQSEFEYAWLSNSKHDILNLQKKVIKI